MFDRKQYSFSRRLFVNNCQLIWIVWLCIMHMGVPVHMQKMLTKQGSSVKTFSIELLVVKNCRVHLKLSQCECTTSSKPPQNLDTEDDTTQRNSWNALSNKDLMMCSNCDVTLMFLFSRQMEEDRGDVLSLVESDDEQIFQDTVPRLPPLTNGRHTTLVQIHRIPSSRIPSWLLTLIFRVCK